MSLKGVAELTGIRKKSEEVVILAGYYAAGDC